MYFLRLIGVGASIELGHEFSGDLSPENSSYA